PPARHRRQSRTGEPLRAAQPAESDAEAPAHRGSDSHRTEATSMKRILLPLLPLALSAALAGCEGCNGDRSAPPAPAATPTAAAAGAEVDCVVIVDAGQDFGAPPLTVNFITDIDCTGEPVTYSWDFGDGTKGGNDPKPSHTYDKPGDYVAVVTVTAPDGGTGS